MIAIEKLHVFTQEIGFLHDKFALNSIPHFCSSKIYPKGKRVRDRNKITSSSNPDVLYELFDSMCFKKALGPFRAMCSPHERKTAVGRILSIQACQGRAHRIVINRDL